METIKVFTAFSGYDSQMMALNRVAERHNGEIDFDKLKIIALWKKKRK